MVEDVVEISTISRSQHAKNSQPDLERCPCRWGGLFFEHLFEYLFDDRDPSTFKGGSYGERNHPRRRGPD